jgi:hypothetical protein
VDPAPGTAILAAAGMPAGAARDVAALFLAATLDGVTLAAPLPPGPMLFLTNHQIALDLLFLAAWLNGPARVPARIVAWTGFASSHPGEFALRLARLAEAEGAVPTWAHPLPIDFGNPGALEAIRGGAPSLVVAADGLRQHPDAAPLRRIDTSLVDVAIALDAPVVPVRFAWALPDRGLPWPDALAPMHVFVGRAIPTASLAALPLGARRDAVVAAMDALGRPAPPGHHARNADRADRVDRLQAGIGLSQTKALAIDLLLTAPPGTLSTAGEDLRRALVGPASGFWRRTGALADFALYASDGMATVYPLLHAIYGEAIAPRRARTW